MPKNCGQGNCNVWSIYNTCAIALLYFFYGAECWFTIIPYELNQSFPLTNSDLAQKNCERTSTCIINTSKILNFKLHADDSAACGKGILSCKKREATPTFALGNFKYLLIRGLYLGDQSGFQTEKCCPG